MRIQTTYVNAQKMKSLSSQKITKNLYRRGKKLAENTSFQKHLAKRTVRLMNNAPTGVESTEQMRYVIVPGAQQFSRGKQIVMEWHIAAFVEKW